MTLQEKIDKRAGLVVQMRSLLDAAGKANRDLSADEQTTYNAMEKDVDSLGSQIERENKLASAENHLRSQRDGAYKADLKESGGKRHDRLAFRRTPEYRDAFEGGFLRLGKNGMGPQHFNVLTVGSDADGGYLVPEEYENTIIKKLYEIDPIRQYANVVTTASDRNIPVRTGIPTFSWLGEGATYTATNQTYGTVLIQAHKCGGEVIVSEELLQDSGTSVEVEINEGAALAFGELESTAFGSGTGVGQPMGLWNTTAVSGVNIQGITGDASATAKYVPDDFVNLFHKLGVPYRANATWLMHDDGVKLARKIVTGISGDKTYIWQPGLTAGSPDTILGRPVVVSKGATAPAVSAKSILFGNLRAYRIQDRLGMSMKRLNELHALAGQIGFLFTKRMDAKLTDANAIVAFTHGAAS